MVANIDKMFFVGQKPWHGEGTKLDNVATSAEAIVAAGMDWDVLKKPLFVEVKDGFEIVDRKFATVRSDNGKALGVVGKGYTPMQNKEAFSFFDSIVGVKEAMYHTAGSLGIGEKVWILAKLPGYIKIKGKDVVDKFLLLANSHDGSSTVEMLFTPIRVVCSNTLNMAINSTERGEISRARHTVNLMVKVEEIREQLGIIKYQYTMFEELSQKMANVQMNQEHFKNYLMNIGIITKDDEGKMHKRTEGTFNGLVNLFEHGKGNDIPEIKNTVWTAYNSVVEHVDYLRGSDKNRTKSLLYGSGAETKQKAWDKAVSWIA